MPDSDQFTLVGCFMLPSDMGILIGHCKDPYQPTSIMERHKGFEHWLHY